MLSKIKKVIGLQSRATLEPLLSPQDVKILLSCSLPYVYKLSERGKLPCLRLPCLGKKNKKTLLRFRKADISRFMEALPRE